MPGEGSEPAGWPRFATLGGLIRRALAGFRGKRSVGAAVRITAVRLVALFGNVGSGLLTAAFLGPDGRGEQAALLIMPSIVGAVSSLGLHASLIYNMRTDPENEARYFGNALLLCLCSSLAACVAGWVVTPWFLSRYDAGTVWLARVLLFCVPLVITGSMFTGVLEAHGRFAGASRVLYLQSLGTLALLVLLAAGGWMTPHVTAWAYVAPSIPTFLYLWSRARQVLRPRPVLRGPYTRRLLDFGLRFYGVDILGGLSVYLDQAVIVVLLDPASVGVYAVALSLSRVLMVAQGAVATVLFPSITGRDKIDVVEIVARVTRLTAVVNIVLALGAAAMGPALLLVLYGSRFQAALVPFLILLAEAVATSGARTLAQAFTSNGRPGAVTAVELAGVVASVGAMLLLVPSYGINGAASAMLLAGLVRLACVAGSFGIVLGVRLPRMVVTRADIAWVTAA